MMKGSRRRALYGCLVVCLSMACRGTGGQRVLRFFFDGVPASGKPTVARGSVPARPVPVVAPVSVSRDHGPYGAKLCVACHETGRSNGLLLPNGQLCMRCHTLNLNKAVVHGPLMAGTCLICHDPHRSAYPYLLVADAGTFCLRCHERRVLRPVEGHQDEDRPCTSCHEAHMSDRRYLLK